MSVRLRFQPLLQKAVAGTLVAATTAGCAADSAAPAVAHSPVIPDVGVQVLQESQGFSLKLRPANADGRTRLFVDNLPPGARWNEASGTLEFRPDFTQGGRTYDVVATATNGVNKTQTQIPLRVEDNISPAAPQVVKRERIAGGERLTVAQTTDGFLDSPAKAGRTIESIVVVPDGATAQNKKPVEIYLHGFGRAPNREATSPDAFRIEPHDVDNSYWWGYADETSQSVQPFTQRRILALLEWVLKNQPGADAERVSVAGGSMGGAGAAELGLLNARHFSHVFAEDGQMVPLNHRPSRRAQLETLWGEPSQSGAWAEQDITRALREDPEARNQFIATENSKDDPVIHYGAVSQPSPITGKSFNEVVEEEGVGHVVSWDEGAHGPPDPVLGAGWADNGWDRSTDPTSHLRRDSAFPAFSRSSANDNPGTGSGNGKVAWNPESGFAAALEVPGDTGWDGDIAGALNRGLRWDTTRLVDTHERLAIPLRVVDGNGKPPPRAGYPSLGDELDAPTPVVTDVTMRRVQSFTALPDEPIRWRYGALQGETKASADGSVTVRGLPVGTDWQTLELTRAS